MQLTVTQLMLAVFAVWRLTELVTVDKISEPIRKRWPVYFWTCQRCVSVWAGIVAAAAYYWYPPVNLVLGLSAVYLLGAQLVAKLAPPLPEVPDGALLIQADSSGGMQIRGRNMTKAQISKILLDAYTLATRGAAQT